MKSLKELELARANWGTKHKFAINVIGCFTPITTTIMTLDSLRRLNKGEIEYDEENETFNSVEDAEN